MPYAYGRGGAERLDASMAKAVAPDIAVGQNKIASNVTVTDKIR